MAATFCILLFIGLVTAQPAAAAPRLERDGILASRVETVTIDLPRPLETGPWTWNTWGLRNLGPRLYQAPLADGATLVGWTDGFGSGHVSLVNQDGVFWTQNYADLPVKGLVGHGDGTFAVLLWDPIAEVLYLSRRTSTNVQLWARELANPEARPNFSVGDSRLAFADGVYAAYFPIRATSGPNDGNYADQLELISVNGQILPGGWDWGPSHALGNLVAYHPVLGDLIAVAVSDCLPVPGLIADRDRVLLAAAGECNGLVASQVGQLAPRADGWLLAFNTTSVEGYDGHGVGLLSFGADPTDDTVIWLTDTDGAVERDPVMAPLGPDLAENRYLVGWRHEGSETFSLAVVDSAGNFLDVPEDVTAAGIRWNGRDDSFRTRPDGTVSWLAGNSGESTLTMYRFFDDYTTASEPDLPPAAMLAPNVPNPFNPRTVIAFTLPAADHVRLLVHDLRGRRVATLWDGQAAAGSHEVTWEGRSESGRPAPAGVYLYRLETRDGAVTRRMVLAR